MLKIVVLVLELSIFKGYDDGKFLQKNFQGVLKTRTWCRGVLNTLLSKYFKEKAPTIAAQQNDPQNPIVGYYCEVRIDRW